MWGLPPRWFVSDQAPPWVHQTSVSRQAEEEIREEEALEVLLGIRQCVPSVSFECQSFKLEKPNLKFSVPWLSVGMYKVNPTLIVFARGRLGSMWSCHYELEVQLPVKKCRWSKINLLATAGEAWVAKLRHYRIWLKTWVNNEVSLDRLV